MKIAVVGMGLIGGSLCRAFHHYTPHTVLGTTRNHKTVEFALSVGAIDEELTNLSVPDVTFIALPPQATLDYLTAHVGEFRQGSIVADICGVKAPIVEAVDQLYHDHGIHYVGTHPMAGKETAGFANSDVDMYKNASYIITPTELTDPEAQKTLETLARSIGFTRIEVTDPKRHDTIISYTSQLAHVVSSAYIKSPTSALTVFREALATDDLVEVRDLLDQGRLLREEVLLRQHQNGNLDE